MTRADTHDVCVVVPAFNEAPIVAEVVRGLRQSFDHVVCVDDGSSDDTGLNARLAGAVVVRHGVNLGQGAALQTGFEYALTSPEFAYVVTFDADGQHRVEDALRAVELCRRGDLEVVLGSRGLGSTTGQTRSRRALLRLALTFTRTMTKLDVSDTHNGLRVLRTSVLDRLRLTQGGMAYASELEFLVARHGLRWAECAISVDYTSYSRAKGQHNLNAVNILCDLAASRMRALP